MKSRFPSTISALVFCTAAALSGCYVRVDDHKSDPGEMDPDTFQTPFGAPSLSTSTQCDTQACSTVPVLVLYSLTQNLGSDHSVVVEAFDNRRFEGSPVTSATITGFNATRPGDFGRTDLKLPKGKYYLRAYVTNDAENAAPYEYGGMKLVSNKPVGFFGAASGAQTLEVDPTSSAVPPVTVTMNYLFKSEEGNAPSGANLRLLFKVAEGHVIESNRKLKIELRDTSDMAANPKATYNLPSDTLLVTGRMGNTEFVARDLAPGKYTIQTYIDSNGNDFLDEGELQQIYKVNGQAAFTTVSGNRTETIPLLLE